MTEMSIINNWGDQLLDITNKNNYKLERNHSYLIDLTFFDFSFLNYRGYLNPDRQTK